jgi:type IV pilus assembly protein PilY1
LSPYLRAGTTPYTAPNIINFIRGEQVAGLRDREVTVAGVSGKKVWKMGDPIHSTPTIIGAPKERYDVLYGDDSYATYFRQYKDRRQVAYVGANDGMLHAFNGGFYHRGDDPTTNGTTEHGWFTTDTKALGQELWGFIPYQLLPQLLWLTRADYTHVYYVDLKPKVTDVRIFADDQDHPGGWGTILIGGFRMGGSCGSCLAGTGAPPMAVTADFGTGTQTRQFYSAYFVLDITNPEKEPVLLWSFAESSLGLTTSYPAIVRVSPSDAAKTDNAAAKWLMVVGSGPTAYGGSSTQTGVFYAVDIKTGPKNADTGANQFFSFTTGDTNSFVGNVTSVDIQFDYRVDVAYGGTTYNNGGGPTWAGKLHRLTTTGCTGSNCVPSSTWGYNTGGGRGSTIVTAAFPSDGSIKVGPVVGAPSITMDEQNHLWLFFGTGRYFSLADKTNSDTQHFIGVKDPVPTGGCTETSPNNCEKRNLLNVSSASVCVVCATGTNQVTGVAGVETLEGSATTTLVGLIQTKDGWYTSLPNARERAMVTPVLLSGTVFFPTFIPNSEICTSSGTSLLYALFYLTGSAYKDSMIGTEAISGSTVAKRSISLGEGVGLASQIAIHLGGQGSGASGAPSSAGCQGRTTGFIQSSTGTLSQVCAKPALAAWSRTVSWSDQRE